MSAETTNEGCAKIAADKLIEMIASTEPVAEVENDEECYVTPQAEIEIDEDGLCSLCVHQSIPGNPDLGNFRFKVGGVNVSVSRDMDGPGKPTARSSPRTTKETSTLLIARRTFRRR